MKTEAAIRAEIEVYERDIAFYEHCQAEADRAFKAGDVTEKEYWHRSTHILGQRRKGQAIVDALRWVLSEDEESNANA